MVNDGGFPCTKEKPLVLTFRSLGYVFAVAATADKLITAILNQTPIAKHVREIVADLQALESHLLDGFPISQSLDVYSSDLLEVEFTAVEIDGDPRYRDLRLWREKSEP